MKSSLRLTVLFPALTLATNRIFSDVGSTACQSCLADVESVCKGPVTSDQFNDCFCAADGDAFAALEDCLTDTDCEKDQYQLLSYYGAHCFAFNDNEEQEFCIDASEDDKFKLSVADMFCTEFVTASGSSSARPTSTEASSSTAAPVAESTTAEAVSTSEPAISFTEATETPTETTSGTTATSFVPTGSVDQGGQTRQGGNSGQGDGDDANDADDSDSASKDDADDDNAGSRLGSRGATGATLLALLTSVFVLRVL